MRRYKNQKNNGADVKESNAILSKLEELQEAVAKVANENALIQNRNTKLINEVTALKELVSSQNKIIVDLISETNVLIKSNISPSFASTKYLDLFPIQNEAQLQNIETEISEETKDTMIATVKNIIGRANIRKKVSSVFGNKLLYHFNLDGKKDKKRLLDYPKIMNCIYKSIYKEQMLTKDAFLKEMRIGVRLVKNRNYKEEFLKRKVQNENNSFFEDETNLFHSDEERNYRENELSLLHL